MINPPFSCHFHPRPFLPIASSIPSIGFSSLAPAGCIVNLLFPSGRRPKVSFSYFSSFATYHRQMIISDKCDENYSAGRKKAHIVALFEPAGWSERRRARENIITTCLAVVINVRRRVSLSNVLWRLLSNCGSHRHWDQMALSWRLWHFLLRTVVYLLSNCGYVFQLSVRPLL